LVTEFLKVQGRSLKVAGRSFPVKGRLVLLAVGKAASTMTGAAEAAVGDLLSEGLAIDVSPPKTPLRRTRVLVAGHPVPDERGIAAAREAESLARGLGKEDLLLLLLSGGGSALLPAPAEGLSLSDKAATTSCLLRAGATIHELNAVRKHLSRLKGGGLARSASPARVVTLVLSDVIGDDLSTIASGPTVPDPTTYEEAILVLKTRGVWDEVPEAVRSHLGLGAEGKRAETAKPGEPFFRRVHTAIVGSNQMSVLAAARRAKALGFRPMILTTRLEGEAREVARVLVSILRECVEEGRPAPPPVCLLAGGETTVTVQGGGQGGRNQELALAAVPALSAFPGRALLASFATDGVDGMSDAAGGVVDEKSLDRAQGLGLAAPAIFLKESDSRNFLGPIGGLIRTGPTGTNVVDLTILLAKDSRA
jgi:hydroxypyruvate reductase